MDCDQLFIDGHNKYLGQQSYQLPLQGNLEAEAMKLLKSDMESAKSKLNILEYTSQMIEAHKV